MQESFDPMLDPESQSPSRENKPKVDKKRIATNVPLGTIHAAGNS